MTYSMDDMIRKFQEIDRRLAALENGKPGIVDKILGKKGKAEGDGK
jgi:hypothetical protein